MRVCRCSFPNYLSCFKLHELYICHRLYLIYRIFYFNNDESIDLRIDTILQPLFFFTDHLTKYIGKLFICFFILIISVVIYIFYSTIFVHLFKEISIHHNYLTFISHIIVSHWLLINIMFNYIQCVRLDPGSSPNFGYSEPYIFNKTTHKNLSINNKMNNVTVLKLTNDGKYIFCFFKINSSY